MEKRTYDALKEHSFWDVLPNGLTMAVVPRPGFSRKVAYFVTNYGSIHRRFTLDGEPLEAPEGVAHFLEHKMFELPGRDVTAEFAALGAVPNAFTSYDMTAYYFSCTENFEESLSLLLEFVSTPYFTKESVDKEQGIIGQEIGMNEDSADTRVFENLARAMYSVHPIREPILGTRETIARITPEILEQCHRAFYRPGNMLLCVVGDVEPERVRGIAMERLPQGQGPVVTCQRQWREEMTCEEPLVKASMEVAMPMFQLGFKSEPFGGGETAVRQEVVGDLAAEALFGESSRLYMRLYEQGLIDSSFGGGFETIEGMAMLSCSGDSRNPEAVREAILEQAEVLVQRGIDEADFLRMKRSALGRRIRDLDSPDSLCFRICAYYFSEFDYLRFPQVYRAVEAEEVTEFIKRTVTRQTCCLSVVEPVDTEV